MANSPNPTCKAIVAELKKLGRDSHRKTYIRHGAPPDSLYGVPIAELKPIQKRVKKDYTLALDLYASGNSDAMYLAGLIADEKLMTRTDLNRWAREATWGMISTCVAQVAAESAHAIPLATKWIDSKQEKIASTGWMTLSNHVSVATDDQIDVTLIERLLHRVSAEIHGERNDVKDSMNGFVIAVGCYIAGLKAKALKVARKIGKVEVDKGNTACKVPDATEYILKVAKMGRSGKKRKTARC